MGRSLSSLIARLSHAMLREAVDQLASNDDRLAALYELNGVPPMWERDEGYPTVVKIILEQQVSLDSAAAAFTKLEAAISPVEPTSFLKLDDIELKRIGFSRQKTAYCRGLASMILEGLVDLDSLSRLGDSEVRSILERVRGIGPWTSDVYLLFALRRSDIWPMGDRALVVSMAESLPLDAVPDYELAAKIADTWRPWRSVAARMLWHAYLKRRGRSLS